MIADWSMISAFAYCPERFHLAYREDWSSTTEAISILFGQSMHKGLNILAKGGTLKEALGEFFLHFAPYDGRNDLRTLEKGEELLTAYVAQERRKGWKTIRSEVNFVIEIGPEFHFAGRIDDLGEKDGISAIQDWKTSTQPWQFVANPNHQATGYLLGAQTIHDPKLEDFYFELLGIFKNSQEGYRTVGTKENKRVESVFQLIHVQRSKRQIESFVKDLFSWKDTITMCEGIGHWPSNTENCNGKYGLCPFHAACLAGEGKESVLEMMYKKQKWNPLTGENKPL